MSNAPETSDQPLTSYTSGTHKSTHSIYIYMYIYMEGRKILGPIIPASSANNERTSMCCVVCVWLRSRRRAGVVVRPVS